MYRYSSMAPKCETAEAKKDTRRPWETSHGPREHAELLLS